LVNDTLSWRVWQGEAAGDSSGADFGVDADDNETDVPYGTTSPTSTAIAAKRFVDLRRAITP